ncbi:Poly(A) polymerase central domain-containing protein [Radiomyces spectabilis]|uniref:Poly(A) polymerase central domain-containing protein n=1 Tax=Radiomyces spectabilis TaxID=64574 RepID=UPI00221E7E5E|nr:Poly(A) polymerase central domain-containing protein [Radiomyces spectabilis]KAI8367702.1 Poly(A) polymerase central domain-containing protein [Radiomyces spectabilis]
MHSEGSDNAWLDYLVSEHIIDGPMESRRRAAVLNLLRSLIAPLMRWVAKDRDLKHEFQCQLMPFGSVGLGAHLANADMDLVFLAPSPVRRRDFFNIFPTLLRKQPTIHDIDVIQRTTVPIIKCTVDSIDIDISFVRLKLNTVPPSIDLLDDNLMRDLDEICLASMDGPRCHRFIQQRIDLRHSAVFRHALQCIKFWAQNRLIYGKPMGYLNGSSWTILLLKTYLVSSTNSEDLTIYGLLRSFFGMWATWPWPTPVVVTDSIPRLYGGSLIYNILPEFEEAVMPIVTPCAPVSSAAPKVTKSTLRVLTNEFERAESILKARFEKPSLMMKKLFKPLYYVRRYKHFIVIITCCDTIKSHETWIRKMAANIPKLVSHLETVPCLQQVHPITDNYSGVRYYHTRQEKINFQKGFAFTSQNSTDFSIPLEPGSMHITYYLIGLDVTASSDGDSVIDVSKETKAFLDELGAKRNQKDVDVHIELTALKRKQVADMIKGLK